MNVSRALKRLGILSDTFFTSGGRTGKLLEELLHSEQLEVLSFYVTGETRENFIVSDLSDKKQYRFGFPGEPITKDEQKEILNNIEVMKQFHDFVVISGSLPAGVDRKFMKQLINICKAKGSKLIVDSSGELLKTAVEEGVFLLKPNIGELASLAGKEKLEESDIHQTARLIVSQGKAEVVVVSLGSQGAILFSTTEEIQVKAPVVEVKSTVGAGDSMIAGMLSVLIQGGNYQKVLSMGIACGSATTMAEGSGLFIKENVEHLFEEIQKQQIK
ncbi:1-phosphofructokinase family hexose kinase [Chryseobacterium wanjuense]